MKKDLPKDITSYDLLKACAVIIMICDHIGFYLFPGHLWWRAVGRIGFPVWFFLAGYANSRDIPPKLWAAALILLVGNFVAGMSIFPLNALFTIILIRLLIDPVMRVSLKSKEQMFRVAVLMLVLMMPSYRLCEYGTQALITAMFGYAVRHRSVVQGGRSANMTVTGFALLSLVNFVIQQQLMFNFSLPQFIIMAAGTLSTTVLLYMFRSATFPRVTASCPFLLRALIQFMGRYTLEIYVFHLLMFKAMGLYFQPHRFVPFNLSHPL